MFSPTIMAMESGQEWNMFLLTNQGILIGPLVTTHRNCPALSQTSFKVRPRVTVLDRWKSSLPGSNPWSGTSYPASGIDQGPILSSPTHSFFVLIVFLTGLYTSPFALSRNFNRLYRLFQRACICICTWKLQVLATQCFVWSLVVPASVVFVWNCCFSRAPIFFLISKEKVLGRFPLLASGSAMIFS